MNSITHDDFIICDKFSKLLKLINVFAYCRRFIYIYICRNFNKLISEIRVNKRSSALNNLIKLAENQSFQQEIQDSRKGKPVGSSYILYLNLFLDNDQLLRIDERWTNVVINHSNMNICLV